MFGICIGPIAATISDSNIEKVTATHSTFSGEEKKSWQLLQVAVSESDTQKLYRPISDINLINNLMNYDIRVS